MLCCIGFAILVASLSGLALYQNYNMGLAQEGIRAPTNRRKVTEKSHTGIIQCY